MLNYCLSFMNYYKSSMNFCIQYIIIIVLPFIDYLFSNNNNF